jgi:hypothetical protein
VRCRITLGGNQGRLEIVPAGGADQRSAHHRGRADASKVRSAPLGAAAPLPPRAAGLIGWESIPGRRRESGRSLTAASARRAVKAPDRGVTCTFGAPRGIRTPNRQIRSLVLCVDLVGSRPIWPAQVGCPVGPDGSRRIPSDRVDDQTDDQAVRRGALGHQTSATAVGPGPDIPSGGSWRTGMRNCRGPE